MASSSNFRDLESANKGKTYFLLASMGLLTWLIAYAALTYFGAGTTSFIVPVAVGISLVGVWGSYYGSDKLVLTMTGAKLINREDAPELFNVIEEVVIASGLPMPKVAIVEDTAPNAFATGRDPDHARAFRPCGRGSQAGRRVSAADLRELRDLHVAGVEGCC